ncbi:HNH endonuclease [Deinococcus fonticola]|uniref:HNH endonuclease n=1 Tax=Deinococcus fonticola TaxID=2528713 RepID=UPI00107555BE|nr:HNH endonuclease [Deinococcus fonticola]
MSPHRKKVECVEDLPDPAGFRAQFDARVDRSGGPDACWPWTGRLNEFGYGRVDIKHHDGTRSGYLTHRIAFMLEHGAMPPHPLVVRHSCIASRNCCNPRHLLSGTQAENMRDRQRQGRTASKSGELNPRARVNARQVVLIRAAHAAGAQQKDLAGQYGIAEATIWRIVHGLRWPKVPMPGVIGWDEALAAARAGEVAA